ncbi:MAG: protein translocase subunit SecF [Actinomycetota bacterium]|nr:protein translocase subunit SecF [Actinomycetota bacterium]MDG2121946.1 protein translocase subunit SecF [Actinomycetota bacterium]
MIKILRLMYRGDNKWDFMSACRRVAIGSAAVVLVCLIAIVARGLNLGIEFEGGSVWEIPAKASVELETIENAALDAGLTDSRVQKITGGEDIFRVRAGSTLTEKENSIISTLAAAASVDAESISTRAVSASFGDQVAGKARRALAVFLALIALYLTLRFEWRMALGALVALFHDLAITVGVYAIFQIEVTPATVVAFLTIMGYSLYDTIVVFDRASENNKALSAKSRITYRDLANVSLNQVIMRSINTTITSVLPVASLLVVGSFIMGATSLQEFAIALLVGLIAGAYSSLFVAMPFVTVLKEREPHWVAMQEAANIRGTEDTSSEAAALLAAGQYKRNVSPRPRKIGKKR